MIQRLRAARALLITLSSLVAATAAENTWDYTVQITAAVQTSPARITLTWPQHSSGTPQSYAVSRKAPGAPTWGSATTLPGTATSYTDTNVAPGTAYEYRIVKTTSAFNGYGYVQAGIRVPFTENRGKIVLVVDRTLAMPLARELTRLESDLVGDGWTVLRRDIVRTASVAEVKAVIKAAYNADPASVKSVFLFGHLAVPYSGQFNPDGHPDHVGAWPADAYYGDMDGVWTDTAVNYTQTLNSDPADAARMSNIPGDGKFDQITLPSPIELQVGRVDLANMPGRIISGGPATFPSELELLRNYLNKDHAFRHRQINPPRRAVLGDYFGVRGGEAFAASGFRSFAPLVGPDNVRNLNREFGDEQGVWIPNAAQNDYLLTYGCGPGNYSTIGGLGATGIYHDGSTLEMVQHDVHGVFNLIFGSWLGDWDHEDNFLRAPLATSHGLVSVWAGRPHWFLHPMGLGETIGYTARIAQNNTGLYETQINSAANRVHIALMGDPTLRLHPVAPITDLHGVVSGPAVALAWSASTDCDLIGYHVYRARSPRGPFVRLTSTALASPRFTDAHSPEGAVYMVRALKLESSPSGTYENLAQGVFWSDASETVVEPAVIAQATPAAQNLFSSDAARTTGSANHAALTIASSSALSSGRDGAASDGPLAKSAATTSGGDLPPASRSAQ